MISQHNDPSIHQPTDPYPVRQREIGEDDGGASRGRHGSPVKVYLVSLARISPPQLGTWDTLMNSHVYHDAPDCQDSQARAKGGPDDGQREVYRRRCPHECRKALPGQAASLGVFTPYPAGWRSQISTLATGQPGRGLHRRVCTQQLCRRTEIYPEAVSRDTQFTAPG